MKIEQQLFSSAEGWRKTAGGLEGQHPQLVLAFGPRPLLESPEAVSALMARYPGSALVMASGAGEIANDSVSDDVVIVTAIAFEATRISCATTSVRTQFESRATGCELASRLQGPGLTHVLVIADGQLINGTDLARGFNESLPSGVTLTGGLAGDGERFERTLVGLNEAPQSGRVVAVAFYGKRLRIGVGSSGGWTPVGSEHIATATTGNILFRLDGREALGLYKEQVGEPAASALPAAALRFPLCIRPATGRPVVRTILAVDEATQSMVFAGDIPSDSRIRFMQASHADLIAGAAEAAQSAQMEGGTELALCISCVGRKLVLGSRTVEEVGSVRRVLGPAPVIAGFYSYGELAPGVDGAECQLHNQTMTITTLREG